MNLDPAYSETDYLNEIIANKKPDNRNGRRNETKVVPRTCAEVGCDLKVGRDQKFCIHHDSARPNVWGNLI